MDKKPVNTQRDTPVGTNVFALTTGKVPVYRYDVSMVVQYKKRDGNTIEFELTKKKAERDATQQENYERCRNVFIVVREHELLRGRHLYYDMQAILFSLEQLPIEVGFGQENVIVDIGSLE